VQSHASIHPEFEMFEEVERDSSRPSWPKAVVSWFDLNFWILVGHPGTQGIWHRLAGQVLGRSVAWFMTPFWWGNFYLLRTLVRPAQGDAPVLMIFSHV
jgi:hypothetical protein